MNTKFDPYKNKHLGERCFILGNGPSLKEENLTLLKDEIIFVVNRGYLALEQGLIDHYDYYVLTDERVYTYDYIEIQKYSKEPRFYSSLIEKLPEYYDGPKENFIPIKRFERKDKRKMGIIRNIMPNKFEDGWGKTRTVVFDAALVAFFMGFKEIYLLGVDLSDYNNSTHFYSPGNRENQLKGEFSNKTHTWPQIINNLNTFFDNNKVKFVNLSKGYKESYPLRTDRLENILGYKLRL